jgi:glycosyltransferase involved in cell wall biosynthesis
MKIGILSTTGNLYSWAGSEETWRLLATHALSEGHQLSLFLPEKITGAEQVRPLLEGGAQVRPRKELTALTRRLAALGWHSRFKGFFKEPHHVLFISTGGIPDCAWMPDLEAELKRCNIPMVFFIQSNAEGVVTDERVRDSLRSIYQRAALVIFLSQHNYRMAERQLGWRFPNARIIMNPLRTPMDQCLPWPANGDGQLKLAEVARFEVGDKRQDQILEALSTDEWKTRNWLLTFYGSGPDEQHIRRLIQFYGLQDKVQLGGFVKDFKEIWRNHHLHILTSYKEGMPLSLIESMFCGRPAVVTRAGGNAELIGDGREGFISPGMHPEIIRETLERAWQARERWAEMGQAAFAKVSQTVPKDWPALMLKTIMNAAECKANQA